MATKPLTPEQLMQWNIVKEVCRAADEAKFEAILKDKSYKYVIKINVVELGLMLINRFELSMLALLFKSGFRNAQISRDALYLATNMRHVDLLTTVLASGVDLTKKKYTEVVSFIFHRKNPDDPTILKILVDNKFDIKPKLSTFFASSLQVNYTNVASYLVSLGANPNGIYEYRFGALNNPSYLSIAARANQIDSIRFLLDNGCDLKEHGEKALIDAVKFGKRDEGDLSAIEYLMTKGIDPNVITDKLIDTILLTSPQSDIEQIRELRDRFLLRDKLMGELAHKEPVKRKKRDF
jgi:hypothetical protein